MKKFTTILACMGFLLFLTAGVAGAYTQQLDLYTALTYNQTFSWEHATPADFEVPFDIVNTATLTINAFSPDGPNGVGVEGQLIGQLSGGIWSWSDTVFNIKDVFATWANGNKLDVSVTSLEPFIYLGTSTLVLDYVNGYPPENNPVPEPATMLLLGSGLASMGLLGRKRKVSTGC
jgi:hypothetical protein